MYLQCFYLPLVAGLIPTGIGLTGSPHGLLCLWEVIFQIIHLGEGVDVCGRCQAGGSRYVDSWHHILTFPPSRYYTTLHTYNICSSYSKAGRTAKWNLGNGVFLVTLSLHKHTHTQTSMHTHAYTYTLRNTNTLWHWPLLSSWWVLWSGWVASPSLPPVAPSSSVATLLAPQHGSDAAPALPHASGTFGLPVDRPWLRNIHYMLGYTLL